jgi:hypothetical protein
MKTKFKNGELQPLIEHRSGNEGNLSSSRLNKADENSKLNRFAGFENREQMVQLTLVKIYFCWTMSNVNFLQLFHADIFNKFDQHDRRFQKKVNSVPYNPREEFQKVLYVLCF